MNQRSKTLGYIEQRGDIMNHRTILRGTQSAVVALMLTLAVPGAAMARNGAGAHGGGLGPGYSVHFGSRTGPFGGGFRGGFGYCRVGMGWPWIRPEAQFAALLPYGVSAWVARRTSASRSLRHAM